jgi:hypothetical protein
MSTQTNELKNRIEAKKHELLARYNELAADARAESVEQRTSIKRKLDELEQHVKDGWEKLTENVSAKLNDWLKN